MMKKRLMFLAITLISTMQIPVSAQFWSKAAEGFFRAGVVGGATYLLKGDWNRRHHLTGPNWIRTSPSPRILDVTIPNNGIKKQEKQTNNPFAIGPTQSSFLGINGNYTPVDFYKEGEKAFLNGNLESAERCFKWYLESHPKDGRSFYYLARIKDKNGSSAIKKALKYLPKDDYEFRLKAYYLQGICSFVYAKDTNAAMASFKAGTDLLDNFKVDPMSDDDMREIYVCGRWDRGLINLARGNKDEARKDFEEVERYGDIKTERVQSAILTMMGLLYEKGDYSSVMKRHISLRELCPEVQKNFQYQNFMSEIYIRMKDVNSACNHIDAAMAYDRDSAWMYTQYFCNENSGLMDSAQVSVLARCLVEKFVEKDKAIGMDELNLALVVFAEDGESEKIIDLYNRYRSIYSEYPPLLVYAADAYFKLEEWEKVIETYNKLTQFVKGDSLSYGPYIPLTINNDFMKCVEVLAQISQYNIFQESAEYLKAFEVSKSLPDSIWDVDLLCYMAAMNNSVDENYERAIELYNTAIGIEPSADAYSGRAYSCRKAGRMEEAKRDYQKVLELESDSATWNTPYAYYFLGEKSLAKKTAEKLLDSDSLTFVDYFEASLFYETIGKERKAYKLLKKALKEEHDKRLYPLVVLSYETPSLRKKVEKLLNEQ